MQGSFGYLYCIKITSLGYKVVTMQIILLGIVAILMLMAMVWIAFRVIRQWNHPKRAYQAQMDDIKRRKRELGIVDDD